MAKSDEEKDLFRELLVSYWYLPVQCTAKHSLYLYSVGAKAAVELGVKFSTRKEVGLSERI
jgi:hypothetical protein